MSQTETLKSFVYQQTQVSRILEHWDSDMMVRDDGKTSTVYLYWMNLEPGLISGTGTPGVAMTSMIGSFMLVNNGGM